MCSSSSSSSSSRAGEVFWMLFCEKIEDVSISRAAFTYEPFLSSKKSIATHHARQRSSILQHEIPHSRMLERPYEHSQTPICPGIWGINSS